ncbi:hypothetical protein DFJ58DRAFT_776935 [Suillus subalutaceus]|uniref:uncharacterized protein n=1 Tax=Suillus subalutaceus TaxID=48586 RepID=UPI001B8806BF|nr:uncharacterized protein DFJ58DRAFT_776935 [Suillus subalutaceus]KAG1861760.1 hypothetical protein DFJ58DRAFT_776935 [Suillus subalutaceus]
MGVAAVRPVYLSSSRCNSATWNLVPALSRRPSRPHPCSRQLKPLCPSFVLHCEYNLVWPIQSSSKGNRPPSRYLRGSASSALPHDSMVEFCLQHYLSCVQSRFNSIYFDGLTLIVRLVLVPIYTLLPVCNTVSFSSQKIYSHHQYQNQSFITAKMLTLFIVPGCGVYSMVELLSWWNWPSQ